MSETKNENAKPAPFTGFTKESVHAKIELVAERLKMREASHAKACSSEEFKRLLAGTAKALGLDKREGTEFTFGMLSLWDAFPKNPSAMRQHLFERKDAPAVAAEDLGDLADL